MCIYLITFISLFFRLPRIFKRQPIVSQKTFLLPITHSVVSKRGFLLCTAQRLGIHSILLNPCWSVLEFWKIKLEKSSSTNWIFSLQKSISKLIFAGYTGSKNQVRNRLKIKFVKLDFSKLIFQKSSTDQQGVRSMKYKFSCEHSVLGAEVLMYVGTYVGSMANSCKMH